VAYQMATLPVPLNDLEGLWNVKMSNNIWMTGDVAHSMQTA